MVSRVPLIRQDPDLQVHIPLGGLVETHQIQTPQTSSDGIIRKHTKFHQRFQAYDPEAPTMGIYDHQPSSHVTTIDQTAVQTRRQDKKPLECYDVPASKRIQTSSGGLIKKGDPITLNAMNRQDQTWTFDDGREGHLRTDRCLFQKKINCFAAAPTDAMVEDTPAISQTTTYHEVTGYGVTKKGRDMGLDIDITHLGVVSAAECKDTVLTPKLGDFFSPGPSNPS